MSRDSRDARIYDSSDDDRRENIKTFQELDVDLDSPRSTYSNNFEDDDAVNSKRHVRTFSDLEDIVYDGAEGGEGGDFDVGTSPSPTDSNNHYYEEDEDGHDGGGPPSKANVKSIFDLDDIVAEMPQGVGMSVSSDGDGEVDEGYHDDWSDDDHSNSNTNVVKSSGVIRGESLGNIKSVMELTRGELHGAIKAKSSARHLLKKMASNKSLEAGEPLSPTSTVARRDSVNSIATTNRYSEITNHPVKLSFDVNVDGGREEALEALKTRQREAREHKKYISHNVELIRDFGDKLADSQSKKHVIRSVNHNKHTVIEDYPLVGAMKTSTAHQVLAEGSVLKTKDCNQVPWKMRMEKEKASNDAVATVTNDLIMKVVLDSIKDAGVRSATENRYSERSEELQSHYKLGTAESVDLTASRNERNNERIRSKAAGDAKTAKYVEKERSRVSGRGTFSHQVHLPSPEGDASGEREAVDKAFDVQYFRIVKHLFTYLQSYLKDDHTEDATIEHQVCANIQQTLTELLTDPRVTKDIREEVKKRMHV